MPLDQDESRAQWPDSGAIQSMQWASPVDADVQSVMDMDDQAEQKPVDTENLFMFEDDPESDSLSWTKPSLVNKESLTTFGRQFSPLLVPLPFALIIFCLTLPLTLHGAAFLPLLPTGILLLALTILQGVLLYFAGANDTLWMLYIGLGYALFVLGGVFATFGPGVALVALAILVVLGLVLARRGIHATKEGYVDLVISFGKYSHTLYPGLNLLLPWETVSRHLNIQETVWTSPSQRVPTSREQDVQLTSTISYQLLPEDAHLAALMVQDWESALRSQFIGIVQSVINELAPGDFISWTQSAQSRNASEANSFNPAAATRWDRICNALTRRMQDQVASWGVQVNWVRIQDLTILPHVSSLSLPNEGGTTHVMKSEPSITPAPLPVRPAAETAAAPQPAAKVEPAKAEPAKATPAKASPVPAGDKAALPNGRRVPIEVLVDFYNAVRQNAITEPSVILDIARQFEALARDPVQSKTFVFDAERAAATLRARAQKLQELNQARTASSAEGDVQMQGD